MSKRSIARKIPVTMQTSAAGRAWHDAVGKNKGKRLAAIEGMGHAVFDRVMTAQEREFYGKRTEARKHD